MIKLNNIGRLSARIRFMLLVPAICIASACACSDNTKTPEYDGTFQRYTEDMTMHSDILGTEIKFSVFLPASYTTQKDKRYPVVYMLHGLGDNNNSWNGKYLHANTRIETLENSGMSEMIYVYPSGFTTYYCNYYNGKYDYMDMFTQELIPYVDKCLRTIADREHRSITGYSMGGFGAMVLALKHPELFLCSAPLSMSFRTDEQYMSESQSGWDGQWGKIFGGIGKGGNARLTDYYKQHCPFYCFTEANRGTLSSVHWFLTCGDDEEQLLIANDALHILLRDLNYAHEYRVGNGGHSSSYWMDALNEVLPFFDHYMNGAASWTETTVKQPNITAPEFNADGTVTSSAYKESGNGTAVYFMHKGLDDAQLKAAMSGMYSSNTTVKFVYLPCDLSEKSLEQWQEFYADSYKTDKKIAVALGEAGGQAIEAQDEFATMVFIDAALGENISVNPEIEYYFSCTDNAVNYKDMGKLYRLCKENGCTFEYRVRNSSGDVTADLTGCMAVLKQYVKY